MAPRPKNPPPDRRHEILEAALGIFAVKGYAATTNADIAREVGITTAALYYYFPSKADLFRAAIDSRREHFMAPVQQLAGQLHDLPPEVALPLVAKQIGAILGEERNQSLLRIVLAEGPRDPEISLAWQQQMIGPLMPSLLGYLNRQMELGRIKPANPLVYGLSIIGPMILLILARDLIRVPIAQNLQTEAFVDTLIDTLLAGMAVPAHKE